jgi:dTDP-glucose 4,6-dehydratase
MTSPALPEEDLREAVAGAGGAWERLRGESVFVTGASGFFGRWVLESLRAADIRHRLGVRVLALSRDPDLFQRAHPHLASWHALSWIRGSVLTLSGAAARDRRFGLVLHMATEGSLDAAARDPQGTREVIAGGMRRTLEFAAAAGAKRFLFTSSGSVYAPARPGAAPIAEAGPTLRPGGQPDPHALGGAAKLEAERLCLEAARTAGLGAVVARCFTFAGPGQPVDGKFAFANFVRDAAAGRRIVVRGDGTAVRSYLYASDLAAWLWTLAASGEAGREYNVGSEQPVTMRALAQTVAEALGAPGVDVMMEPQTGRAPGWYVPSTLRARSGLGLRETVPLAEAILRTARWLHH